MNFLLQLVVVCTLTISFSSERLSPLFQEFNQDIEWTEYSETDTEEKEDKKDEMEDKIFLVKRNSYTIHVDLLNKNMKSLDFFKRIILSKVPTPPPEYFSYI